MKDNQSSDDAGIMLKCCHNQVRANLCVAFVCVRLRSFVKRSMKGASGGEDGSMKLRRFAQPRYMYMCPALPVYSDRMTNLIYHVQREQLTTNARRDCAW